MDAKLIVIGGKANKSEVKLKLPTLVGRDRNAGLTIAHATVSRRHCEIAEVDGALVVRDFGSTNGTYIDDARIQKEAVLMPGAKLTVGPLSFRAEYQHVGAFPSIGVLPPPGSISDTQPFEPHPEYAQETGTASPSSDTDLPDLEEVAADEPEDLDFLAEPPAGIDEVDELPEVATDEDELPEFGDELASLPEQEEAFEEPPLAEVEDAEVEEIEELEPLQEAEEDFLAEPPPEPTHAAPLVSDAAESEWVAASADAGASAETSDELIEPELPEEMLAEPPAAAEPEEPGWIEEPSIEPAEIAEDKTIEQRADFAPAVDATVNWTSEPPVSPDPDLRSLAPSEELPALDEPDASLAIPEESLPAAEEEVEDMGMELFEEAAPSPAEEFDPLAMFESEPAQASAEQADLEPIPEEQLEEQPAEAEAELEFVADEIEDAPPIEAAEASQPIKQALSPAPATPPFFVAAEPVSFASKTKPVKKKSSWWPFGKKKADKNKQSAEKKQDVSELVKPSFPSSTGAALPRSPSEDEPAEETAEAAPDDAAAGMEMETVMFSPQESDQIEVESPALSDSALPDETLQFDKPKPGDKDLTDFFKGLGKTS